MNNIEQYHMSYKFKKHDMEILVDALASLHKQIKYNEKFDITNSVSYSIDDVTNLYLNISKEAYGEI